MEAERSTANEMGAKHLGSEAASEDDERPSQEGNGEKIGGEGGSKFCSFPAPPSG